MPPGILLIVREFLARNSITVLEYPSTLLAGFCPLRFFLVPQMQTGAAGGGAAFGGCDDD